MLGYQTYQDFEHLIIEEWQSLNSHRSKIKNGIYIPCDTHGIEEHIGIGQKIRQAVQHAKGDLHIIWSSDDFFAPDYLQTWVDLFTNNSNLKIASFDKSYYYNVVDSTYGLLDMNKGGHCAWTKDLAELWETGAHKPGADTRFINLARKGLNATQATYTNAFLKHHMAIRHTTANRSKRKKGKVISTTIVDPKAGYHTAQNDRTTIQDVHWDFLYAMVKDPYLREFYTTYEAKYGVGHGSKKR